MSNPSVVNASGFNVIAPSNSATFKLFTISILPVKVFPPFVTVIVTGPPTAVDVNVIVSPLIDDVTISVLLYFAISTFTVVSPPVAPSNFVSSFAIFTTSFSNVTL